MNTRRAVFTIALLAAGLMPHQTWAQCSMCRQALQSPEAAQLAAALRSGILLLLAAPFVVFGMVAAWAVKARRRHEEQAGREA